MNIQSFIKKCSSSLILTMGAFLLKHYCITDFIDDGVVAYRHYVADFFDAVA